MEEVRQSDFQRNVVFLQLRIGRNRIGFGKGMQDIVFNASDANGAYLIFFRANDGRTAARKWIVR